MFWKAVSCLAVPSKLSCDTVWHPFTHRKFHHDFFFTCFEKKFGIRPWPQHICVYMCCTKAEIVARTTIRTYLKTCMNFYTVSWYPSRQASSLSYAPGIRGSKRVGASGASFLPPICRKIHKIDGKTQNACGRLVAGLRTYILIQNNVLLLPDVGKLDLVVTY